MQKITVNLCGSVALACLALVQGTTRAQSLPSFRLIADNNTVISEGFWAGRRFTSFESSSAGPPAGPVVTNGRVAFFGSANGGTNVPTGIFSERNGVIERIVDPAIQIPNVGPSSPSVEARNLTAGNGEFEFRLTEIGFYRTTTSGLRTVIDERLFRGSYGPSAIDGARSWVFREPAGTTNSVIASAQDGVVQNVLLPGGPTPNAPGFIFQGFNGRVRVNNGVLAVFGSSRNVSGTGLRFGIYRYDSSTNVISRIVDDFQLAQFNGGRIEAINNVSPAWDGRTLVFSTTTNPTARGNIYRTDGSIITPIAISGTPAPGGGTFVIDPFDPISSDESGFAFQSLASGGGRAVYFSYLGSPLARLIGPGDQLFGKTVLDARVSSSAMSGNQLGFSVRFTDLSSGVYVATIPEPGTLVPVIFALAPLLCRRRRV